MQSINPVINLFFYKFVKKVNMKVLPSSSNENRMQSLAVQLQ